MLPVEDIFVDGVPRSGLTASHEKVKVCGMALGEEMAILVSNYAGLKPDTRVTISAPVTSRSEVWDLHARRKIGALLPGGRFEVVLGDVAAHLFYVGNKYAAAIRP